MTQARFATYNLLNYGQSDTPEERRRIERVEEVIARLDVQVPAVQEIITPNEAAAGELLAKLADSVGAWAAWSNPAFPLWRSAIG